VVNKVLEDIMVTPVLRALKALRDNMVLMV
jgi:hypothetical protein